MPQFFCHTLLLVDFHVKLLFLLHLMLRDNFLKWKVQITINKSNAGTPLPSVLSPASFSLICLYLLVYIQALRLFFLVWDLSRGHGLDYITVPLDRR